MSSKNNVLIENIVKAVGGIGNIASATNCMTRLRMKIINEAGVDYDSLKAIPGVLGVVKAETLQVVVGPGTAKKLSDLLTEEYLISKADAVDHDWEQNKALIKNKQKQSKLKSGLEIISGIFIPMIPAIIAAGIFQGLSGLLKTLIDEGVFKGPFFEVTQLLFGLIGTSFLAYFAIYTGVNAAKRFGATEALGGMVGGMSIAPTIIDLSTSLGLYDVDQPLNSILTTGKGGIIGVIFGVYLLAIIERFVRKRVPDVLDLIVTPVVTLLMTSLLMIFVVMPVSGFLSDWLVQALSVIIGSDNTVVSIISGYVLAAVFLPMVLLGLHHGLIPIYAVQLEVLGGVSLFPVLAMAGAGQVGAAIAIYFLAKKAGNDRLLKVISGALPAGILGIGEPLIYGVTLPLGKPFITAGLGAGFGGAYVMMTQVMANAWGPSGLVAVPLMQPNKMIHFIIGLVIAYAASFIITKIIMKKEDVLGV